MQAKTKLSDASFSEWLQRALGWTDEDARRFIEVRDRFDNDDADELGVIDLSVLQIAASFVGNQAGEAAGAPEPGSVAGE